MDDRFMAKHVALILIEYDVVLSYCIIHLCLVTQWEHATIKLNAIMVLKYKLQFQNSSFPYRMIHCICCNACISPVFVGVFILKY